MAGCAAALGGVLGDGRGQVVELVLLLVFASVLLLIIDLDRPRDGLLNVSQQAMIDLQQQMRSAR